VIDVAAWKLTDGLQNLRRQVDTVFPDRDRATDGTLGDTAHQARTSGHNRDDTPGSRPAWDGDADATPEVRAWDMDADLRGGVTGQQLVDHIRDLPGLSSVLRYIIFNRKIYHSRDGFAPAAYTGSNAHTAHVHFEGAWTQVADNNTTFDYHLEDLVALTDADKDWFRALFERTAQPDNGGVTSKIGRDALDQGIPNGVTGVKAPAWAVLRDLGVAVLAVGERVGVSYENLAAAIAHVDEEVLAALPGRSAAEQAAAIEALLGPEQAAAVGRILAA
jgi:hypothetical protein